MKVPQRWWWIAAIAVPIVVAVIGIGPDLLGLGSDEPNLVYNRVEGSQFQGDVEVREGGQPLADEVVALLEDAMQAVEDGAPDKAVPLFQAAAEVASTPAVLNNLGAAYLAAGEPEQAREVLLRARAAEVRRPGETAAVEHNLRQLAQATGPSIEGPAQPTEWPGVTAQLTRFDNAGGLVTLEITYANSSTDPVEVCIWPGDDYLLDEASGQRWDPEHSDGRLCEVYATRSPQSFAAGGTRVTWAKFLVDDPMPARFSAVVSGVVRPFEGLTLAVD